MNNINKIFIAIVSSCCGIYGLYKLSSLSSYFGAGFACGSLMNMVGKDLDIDLNDAPTNIFSLTNKKPILCSALNAGYKIGINHKE